MAQEANRRPVVETGRQRRERKSSKRDIKLADPTRPCNKSKCCAQPSPAAPNKSVLAPYPGESQRPALGDCVRDLVLQIPDRPLAGPPRRHSPTLSLLSVLWRSEGAGQMFKTEAPIFTDVIRPWLENWSPTFPERLLAAAGARALAAVILWFEIRWDAGSLKLTRGRKEYLRWQGLDDRRLADAISDLGSLVVVDSNEEKVVVLRWIGASNGRDGDE
jgi:hypothetical protein